MQRQGVLTTMPTPCRQRRKNMVGSKTSSSLVRVHPRKSAVKNSPGATMTKSLHLFAQLAKIDESRHEVWGVATAEVVDKEGEIFDYLSSRPYFESWSAEISKASGGKSLGNVREMHAPHAVGKLVSIEFDDELKQINIGAKIVDDDAWQKCAQGVYTGFSIGGAYVKVWEEGEFVRFTASPSEVSVVDNPCVPTAHFTAIKTDGTRELRKFKKRTQPEMKMEISKIGAQHSKETLDHLQAIQNHLDAASDNQSAASQHLSALLGNGDYDDDYQDDGSEQSADKIARQKMRKARAASALIKVNEIEQNVARLRHEMESNNAEVSKSLHNLLALIEKLVGSRPEASRVARTTMPAVTVRKEDDGGVKAEKGEKSVHELVKQALQNPQRSSDYTR
jgi:hypothetical protein